MTGPLHAIDCDVHPTVPDMKALLPYLDDFWRETVEERGINSLETVKGLVDKFGSETVKKLVDVLG